MKELLHIFLVAMVPIIELRGSIPIGLSQDLPVAGVVIASIIGNFLPVPFILLFIRKILELMKKIPFLKKIALWIEKKGTKNKSKVMKYASFGLMLFVGIPLPGTGAWTGALVAAMMDMRLKYALPSIFCGILLAAAIVTSVAYFGIEFLSIFLG